jgi:hypothetical protein
MGVFQKIKNVAREFIRFSLSVTLPVNESVPQGYFFS